MKTARRREQFDMRDDDGPRDDHEMPQTTAYAMLRKGPLGLWIDVRTINRSERGVLVQWGAIQMNDPEGARVNPQAGIVMVVIKAQIQT